MNPLAILRSKRAGYIVLAALALVVAIKAYSHPLPTFDRLLYAATVAHLHTTDPDQIAQKAFELAGRAGLSAHLVYRNSCLRSRLLSLNRCPFTPFGQSMYMQSLSLGCVRFRHWLI